MGLSVSISGYGVYVADEMQADKRSVDDVLLVAHQLVHGFPGGVAAVAEALQMPKGTLTHKLNPTNFTHHLTLREALLMQRATGSTVLLEAEAGFLGQVCQPLVRRLDVLPPSEALTALAMAFAQYLQAMAEPIHRAAAEGGWAFGGGEPGRREPRELSRHWPARGDCRLPGQHACAAPCGPCD